MSLYFITGGCRSGKSAYGQQVASMLAPDRVYIATAEVRDSDMAKRVTQHRMMRDDSWSTVELPAGYSYLPLLLDATDVAANLFSYAPLQQKTCVLLFDCLTLWLAGCLEKGMTEVELPVVLNRLLGGLQALGHPVVLVSNEVGLGGIAGTSIGRAFCDLTGAANQIVATKAGTVILVVSGIPVCLKGSIL